MGGIETEVFWETLIHPIFQNKPIHVAATKKGLCRITWPEETLDTLRAWVDKHIPDSVLIQNSEEVSEYVQQLQEFFDGVRKEFTLPLDLRGTDFQIAVWQTLTQIPFGQTKSYAEIAETMNKSKAVRAVGTANGANPIPIVVPCHRVLGKGATLTGFRGGLHMKEVLLRLEGNHDYNKKGHARFQF